MFWDIVLPVQITFGVLFGLLTIAVLRAPTLRQKSTFVRGVLLGIILFVPSCTVIMTVTDFFRFGVFKYPDTAAVRDPRVRGDLPETATGITVAKSTAGHKAKFQISKISLDEWHQRQFKLFGEATKQSESPPESGKYSSAVFDTRFGDLKWKMPIDVVLYHGPSHPNGAGYSIWYSAIEQTAYEDVSYW